MAKKKAEVKPVNATAEPPVGHARIELPGVDFGRLQRQAKRFRLSVSAYVRQAVMKAVEADEATEAKR